MNVKLLILSMMALAATSLPAQKLTIIHTNDTHSQIDPREERDGNLGGILRRKALIDSIREAVPGKTLLVDAGDADQGTLFFIFFKGEVEQRVLNALGYDMQILGNHEFDNGMEQLARNYSIAAPAIISSNYDFTSTPLNGMILPYKIEQVGDKKVGFIGINIDPKGLIEDRNYGGMVYRDALHTADSLARRLKTVDGVDRVVALTHIGYETTEAVDDRRLAQGTSDIDVIIGGHSHTFVDPASPGATVMNKAGRPVLIVQTGSRGEFIGEVTLDLEPGGSASGVMHRVDKRLDSRYNPSAAALTELLRPYRHTVDSIGAIRVGTSESPFEASSRRQVNWVSDFVKAAGDSIAGGNVDFAIVNKGGLRASLPAGDITKGMIMDMMPFDNRIVVIEISGEDLLRNFGIIAEKFGWNGVSREVDVTYSPDSKKIKALVNGHKIDPDKTYRVATISYLAGGGDYMKPLKNGRIAAESDKVLFNDIIDALESGFLKNVPLKADDTERMHLKKK